jgi:hypothetical protein
MPCLLIVLLLVSPIYAQSQGFVSAGRMVAGDDGAQFTLSAGGEKISASGLSAGGDAVVSFGRTGFRPGFPSGEPYRQYVLSGLVGAHVRAFKGFAPFVNGGVSIVTDPDCCGPGVGWNVGGGANYWLTSRFGIRADLRLVRAFAGEGGLAMGRVGMAFR